MGVAALSFLAGSLSILSPCVLPLLPIVVAAALQEHRHGPLVLAGGLVVTSTATGLFFASFAFTPGIEREAARTVAAALMAAAGLVLLIPAAQQRFAELAAPLATAAGRLTSRLPPGLGGQLVLGALLGFVWTPCTGPTLAAAITLATRSENVAQAAAVMFTFSIGAALPLLLLAYSSRRAVLARETRLARVASIAKPVMGVMLLAVAALALTGTDKLVEAWMVDHMPGWLLELTTTF
jgi:cytochrome c-type biogenesis protein